MTGAKMWGELRRSPGSSLLVVIAVALASALAGLGAVVGAQLVASGGVLFEQARVPHLVQMHAGPIDRRALERFASGHPEVSRLATHELVGLDVTRLELTPGASEANSTTEYSVTVQHDGMDLILGLDGTPARVAVGEVGVPVDIALDRGIRVGDPVTLDGRTYRVGALVRDALMGSPLASSRRLLVHAADLDALRSGSPLVEWLIEFELTDPAQAPRVADAYLTAGLPAKGPTVDLATLLLMGGLADGLAAAVMLLLAGLVGLIAALVLSLTVRTAVAQERRSIGVLRAIGLPRRAIRRLVLTRHLALVAVGAAIGAGVAMALTPSVTESLRVRLGGDVSRLALTMPWVLALLMGVIGWSLARGALNPALRGSARAAMRGETGRPAGRRRVRTRGAPTMARVALARARRAPLDHLTLAAVVFAATLLAALPLGLRATLASPTFLTSTGLASSDLRIDLKQDADLPNRLAEVERALASDPQVARHTTLRTARIPSRTPDGAWTGMNVTSGDHQAFPLAYLTGRAPLHSGEIALSELNADTYAAVVGGTVTVRLGGRETPLSVVGVYRDITNGGRGAQATLDASEGVPLWTVVHAELKPGVSPTGAVDQYAALAAPARVTDVETARADLFGPLERGATLVAAGAVGVASALTAMLSALVLRLFLAQDRGRRAVVQAIGAPLARVRVEYAYRVLGPELAGVSAGVIAAPLLGSALMSLVGRPFGAATLPLTVDPITVGILLPSLLLGSVAAIVRWSVPRTPGSTVARLVAGQES